MTSGYDHLFTFTTIARYCITMGFVRSFVLILSFFLFLCLWCIGSVGDCESATLCWQVDRALLNEKNWVGKAQDDGLVLATNDTPLEEIKPSTSTYLHTGHYTLLFEVNLDLTDSSSRVLSCLFAGVFFWPIIPPFTSLSCCFQRRRCWA